MTDALELVLGKLEGVRQHGGYWMARCPAHDDKQASLSVARGTEQPVIFKCHANCERDAILDALGLTLADISKPRDAPKRDQPIAVYPYTDEAGDLLYEVVRKPGKKFAQRRPDGRGGWIWSLGKIRRVPYRLPAVIAAIAAGETIYIPEGEKDVHALESAGVTATCNSGGAGKWRPEFASIFRGATVVIIADKDKPGLEHAEQVAANVRFGGAEDVVIRQAAEGKDAADHLAAGWSLADFQPVAEGVPDAPGTVYGAQVVRLADVEPERISWLWDGHLPLGKLVVLDGDPGVGKSSVSLDIAARVTTGSPMPDGSVGGKGSVLVLSAEDGLADTIRPRLDAAGADPARVVTITEIKIPAGSEGPISRPVSIPADLPAIATVIVANDVKLVIVDVLMAYLGGDVNAHRDQDIRRALHALASMAERTGCCVIVLRHLNKSGGPNALYRGGGSIGIIGAARAGFMCGIDPDDETGSRRVFANIKMNIAAEPPSLAYQLVSDELHGVARIQWGGVVDHRARDLLSEPGNQDERTERDEAVEWLTGYLIDHGGEATAGDVIKAAFANGFSKTTVHRARLKARITTGKAGFGGGWLWRLDLSKIPEGSEDSSARDTESSEPSAEPSHSTSWPDDSIGAELARNVTTGVGQ